MKLSDSYKELIDREMGLSVEGWSHLSYLDPSKMIVSGLVGSLAEIEERQKRLALQVLSLTPSYLGFEIRPAATSQILLKLNTRDDIDKVLRLEKNHKFIASLQANDNKKNLQARLTNAISIVPVQLESYKIQNYPNQLSLHCSLTIKGPTPYIDLYYLADSYNEIDLFDPKVIENFNSKMKWNSKSIKASEFRITDQTSALTRSGFLRLELQKGGQFQKGVLDLEIIWNVKENKQSSGKILINVCEASFVELREWYELAKLKGESWEELILPEGLLEVPSELLLELPGGGYTTIRLVKDKILSDLLTDPGELKDIYFYNPNKHSLVFPSAQLLTGQFNGGLPVVAKEAVFSSASYSELKFDDQQSNGEILGLSFLSLLQVHYNRETESEFLKRFYSGLRSVSLPKERRLDLVDIEYKLLTADTRIRNIEFKLENATDSQKQCLNVFVSLEPFISIDGTRTHAAQIPSDLLLKLDSELSSLLPLDVQWKVRSFKKRKLKAFIIYNQITNKAIEKATLLNGIQLILSPDGPHRLMNSAELSLREIFSRLSTVLGLSSQIEGTLQDSESGCYLESLCRESGSYFEVEVYV